MTEIPDRITGRTERIIKSQRRSDPSNRILKGEESLTYHNNSPDSLRYLVVRLYPDFYRKGSPRDFSISPTAINDGVTLSKLIIKSDTVDLNSVDAPFYRTGTNMIIQTIGGISPANKYKPQDWLGVYNSG